MLHVYGCIHKVAVGEHEGTGLLAIVARQSYRAYSCSAVQFHALRTSGNAVLWQAYRDIWR